MPDTTMSDALKEAYAAAPANLIVYHTLELYHPAFDQPIRVVRDSADLEAFLEDDAPRDAGEEVLFIAFPFDITPPSVDVAGSPMCTIEIGNTTREVTVQLEAAMSSAELLEVIYRQYISTDLSGPQNNPPLTLTVFRITADVFRVRAQAGFGDLANRRFPSQDYTAERFPGLVLQ